MTSEIPKNNPEKEKPLDDNARKFITEPLSSQFFDNRQTTSFMLVVDWLETDEASEKKLAHKTFEDGMAEILLITKVTQANGDRKTVKQPLTEEQYNELVGESMLHLEKARHEFLFTQDGATYDMKYDVFTGGKLFLLEVDSKNDDKRVADIKRGAFEPKHFPAELKEVTEDISYTGYRVCELLT